MNKETLDKLKEAIKQVLGKDGEINIQEIEDKKEHKCGGSSETHRLARFEKIKFVCAEKLSYATYQEALSNALALAIDYLFCIAAAEAQDKKIYDGNIQRMRDNIGKAFLSLDNFYEKIS